MTNQKYIKYSWCCPSCNDFYENDSSEPKECFCGELYDLHKKKDMSEHVNEDGEINWYCPNGCQIHTTKNLSLDNCGSCGSLFSTDNKSYDDSLLSCEEESIAEFERKEEGKNIENNKNQKIYTLPQRSKQLEEYRKGVLETLQEFGIDLEGFNFHFLFSKEKGKVSAYVTAPNNNPVRGFEKNFKNIGESLCNVEITEPVSCFVDFLDFIKDNKDKITNLDEFVN